MLSDDLLRYTMLMANQWFYLTERRQVASSRRLRFKARSDGRLLKHLPEIISKVTRQMSK